MLRIDLFGHATLRMSGRLAEGCREEVKAYLDSDQALESIVVDLTEVTYIDHAGEDTLRWLGRRGARFTADNPYALHICDRLRLKIQEPHPQSGQTHDSRGGQSG
jgi:hypothetical protein